MTKISHFWTWISLKPVGQSWSNFVCVAALGWGKGCTRFWGRLDHSGERSLPFGLLVSFYHWFKKGYMYFSVMCFNAQSVSNTCHEFQFTFIFNVMIAKFFLPRACSFELRHDKTNKMSVLPAKTQISLGICPVWSEFSLSAWRKLGSLATHSVHNEDSDQTWQMPRLNWAFAGSDQTGQMSRLIWVFAGHTVTLLVLSWGISFGHLIIVSLAIA